MILETVSVGSLETNCYIVADSAGREAIIIDPGDDELKIKKILEKHKLKCGIVVNTHGHVDHIKADDKFGAVVYAHKDEVAMLKDSNLNLSTFLFSTFAVKSKIKPLEDKEEIKLGRITLEVIHTPGHTPGGISLLMKSPQDNILFSGDTLFHESIGRTDIEGASTEQILKSIKERLLVLPGDTLVYPGHGSPTTIGHEKQHNPYARIY